MIEFYCSRCGEWSQVSSDFMLTLEKYSFMLTPGKHSVTCPECGTCWTIKVEFYENEQEEDEAMNE